MEKYSTAIVIGRWQLFHKNHQQLIQKALDVADKVVVLFGSAKAARSIKNPFTFSERKEMLLNSFSPEDQVSIVCEPIQDFYYSDSLWITNVQRTVAPHIEDGSSVCLVGAYSDDSSYYLKYFPQWDFVPFVGKSEQHATELREKLFHADTKVQNEIGPFLPIPVIDHLIKNFIGTETHVNLIAEAINIKQYKQMWAEAPFPVTFVTVDAVVVQQGHVLVVKRKFAPGKGLWALPGGFIRENERLEAAAIRELKEETRIKVAVPILKDSIKDSGVFDHPKRSLRGRTITHAYFFQLKGLELPEVKGGDDADRAWWIPLSEVYANEHLFFEDHAQIIQKFISRGEG